LIRRAYTKWKDLFHSFIIQGISIALVFAGNLLLARYAGTNSYGIYVHVFNWVSLLAVVATGGRDDLVLAELPRYQADGRWGQIGYLIKRTNRHVLIGSMITILLFLSLVWLLHLPSLYEYRTAFGWAAIAIYCTAFLTLNQLILQALDHVRLSQVVEKLVKPGLLIFFIWIAAFSGHGLGAQQLILLADLVLVLCFLLLVWLIYPKVRDFLQTPPEAVAGKGHTTRTFIFFSITLLTLLVTKVTMLILPWFAMQKDIGIFNICYRMSDLIIYPFFLMHTVLPQLFAKHSDTDRAGKQSMYDSATRMMTWLSLPLLAVNILAGRYFLGWFGRDFAADHLSLVLLSISQFFYAFFGPASTMLMMQGYEKYSAFCLLGYVVLLTLANIWLIPLMGITGGALATLICCFIYNVTLSISAYRRIGVISPWLKRRPIRSS